MGMGNAMLSLRGKMKNKTPFFQHGESILLFIQYGL